MEVSHHKVGVVQLYIDGGVARENTGQTSGNEHGNKTDTKQAGSGELNITAIKRGDPVEYFTAEGTAMISVKITKKLEMNRLHPT